MKKLFNVCLFLIILSFFTGCAGSKKSLGNVDNDSSGESAKKPFQTKDIFPSSYYLEKATAYENNDELQTALVYMKIAGTLNPDNQKIIKKISALESTINDKADEHFRNGVIFYNKKRFKAARKQFLTALRYDPHHEEALDYLKNRLIPNGYIRYRVEKNDTLKNISEKFYKDPEKDFLIVYFNDLKSGTEPLPGTVLKLPILPSNVTRPLMDISKELLTAKKLLREKRFKKALAVTERILKYDPMNPEAVDLKNSTCYQIGIQLQQKKKYSEAMKMFKKTAPACESAQKAIQDITQKEFLKAEKLLKHKKYDAAIEVTENILDDDKSNKAAKNLMNTAFCQKGKSLLIRKKYFEALTVLDGADPAYDCVDKTISSIKKAMQKQAEIYYLRGVKNFLNEDLQSAIKQWEMTLALNPGHKKAKENIKKAKNLLDKLNKVN